MRGLQEVFGRRKRRPREPRPDGASRLSLVRQFERKEEMKAYPSDSERLGQSTNLTQTLAGLNGVSGQCVRSSRETRDSSAFPMSDRRQSARIWPPWMRSWSDPAALGNGATLVRSAGPAETVGTGQKGYR